MSKTKEELERDKLTLEVSNLARPVYATPTFWLSVATAIVAVLGTIAQSYLSKIEKAQAELVRDRAVFKTKMATKDLGEVEQKIAVKQKEVNTLEVSVASLKVEADQLKKEKENQTQKTEQLLAAVSAAPSASVGSEVRNAAKAAANSLFSIAIYGLNIDSQKFQAAVSYLQKTGYTVLLARQLSFRPSWLASKATVLFYDGSAKSQAQSLGDALAKEIGSPVAIEMGAGLGIPKGQERTSFRIHLVR